MEFCSKEDIRDQIDSKKEEIKKSVQKNTSMGYMRPTLAIIQVGNNPASNRYVKGKIADCDEVGITALHFCFDADIDIATFAVQVSKIVSDVCIHSVIIQKPLPDHLEKAFDGIIAFIPPKKDVDGFKKDTLFDPCTPKGIIDYIESRKGKNWLDGKEVVIINRSELVGRPLARMMLDRNATVTVCHSHTKALKNITVMADMIVSAIGKPKMLNADYVYPGGICIDVGIGFDESGKMCGDFDRESVLESTPFCTPVPGGVGLLTRLALLENVMKAHEYQKEYCGRAVAD